MWYRIQVEKISFSCKAKAKNNRVVGLVKGSLAVHLKAEPVAGAANVACLKLLGDFFNIAGGEVQLLHGHKSPLKRVAIPNNARLLAQLAAC